MAALIICAKSVDGSDITISPDARISILTCTPGPDLYSLFGHSAIRYEDVVQGRRIDWVYNYGTFQFDEDFYVKFARGKLDYLLSKEDFAYFQQEYIYTGRGIYQQDLNLNTEEKQRLLDLLEENFLPENRTYRYDFFYDNCSTRIRDILIRATSGLHNDGLGFRSPDREKLVAMSKINFSYVHPAERTYRLAIQPYLDYQPWSDFGIDLALGLPCDKTIEKNGYMFLPDSVMSEFNYAIYQDRALVLPAEEILPQEYELSTDSIYTPIVVMMMFLILHLLTGFLALRRGWTYFVTDRIILIVTGLLGVLVVFLWFFTDHTSTAWNLNLLWANPVNLVLGVLPVRILRETFMKYLVVWFFILALLLVFWFALPQRLNLAVIPLVLSLIFTVIKLIRPSVFLGSKASAV